MIQIFGTNKSFDCKAAQRFFKERRIPFQFVDLKEKEMSAGEFDSVVTALARTEGGRDAAIDALIDKKAKDYASIAYLDDSEKESKLFEKSGCPLKTAGLPQRKNRSDSRYVSENLGRLEINIFIILKFFSII